MNKKDLKYLALSIILLSASFSFVRNTNNTLKNNKRFESLRSEVSDLNKEKALLQEEIAFQKSDDFIEQEARNKLNMIKSNEELYVLENSDVLKDVEPVSSITPSTSKKAHASSNMLLWADLLF